MLTGLPKNRDFRQISDSADRKKIFHEKWIPLQPIYNRYASLSKKSQKTNDKILRKVQKTVISGIFPAFSPGKKSYFENRAPSHFGHHHSASLCKKSENSDEPIPRKAGNRHTDGRTDGHR